jgi:hypothetical protein
MQAGVVNVSDPAGGMVRKVISAMDESFATGKPGPVLDALTELEAFAKAQQGRRP